MPAGPSAAADVHDLGQYTTPALAATPIGRPIEIGVKFRADTAGAITGLRFYKGTANTGTHVGNLWTTGGTQLGSATFTSETASGWQQVVFATPVPIAANTIYVASYYAASGYFAFDSAYFTAAVDAPPLHALYNGTSGGNGVYKYGGGIPTQTWNSSNYWVDVVFTTRVGSDTTPPTVTGRTPASGATGVGIDHRGHAPPSARR